MSLKTVKDRLVDLPSFITDDDIACYYKYSRLVHGIVLDVGTGWGKSFVALASSNPRNNVYSIDPGTTPIQQGWAKDAVDYANKIYDLILNKKKLKNAYFLPVGVGLWPPLQVAKNTFSLIHLDNWVELNQVGSDELLTNLISMVKPGGYILFRNHGHNDRQPYTDSIDRVTKDLTFIEKKGMIAVYQK